jgi:hypothetical protein
MGAKPSDSRNVLSGIIASFALLFLVVGGAFYWDRVHQAKAAELAKEEELELTQMISEIPNEQPTPDEGTAGMAKGNGGGSKPKQEKAGGGGGGGREEQTPASFGKLPQADLRIPQVVAPDPHPPVIKNPALPMPATLDADPVLFHRIPGSLTTGIPNPSRQLLRPVPALAMVSVREQAAALAPARVAVMVPAKVATLVAATGVKAAAVPVAVAAAPTMTRSSVVVR